MIGIEDVVYDETEIVSIHDQNKNENVQNTFPLSTPNEVIIETSIKRHRSLGKQILNFFNKLF